MKNPFVKAVVLWALKWLNRTFDTELDADIKEYDDRIAQYQEDTKSRTAYLAQLQGDNQTRETLIAQEQARRQQLDAELNKQMAAADESAKKLDEILNRKPEPVSDSDALRNI